MDVFVGFFYDEEKEKQLLQTSKTGVSAAANQYQKGFLSGFTDSFHILTTISTGTFPKRNKRLFFKKETKKYGSHEIVYLPFINVHFIKDWMFKRGLYKTLSKIVEKHECATVYVYSLNVVFEKVMARIKKKYGDRVDYCLIIPDLPGNYGIVRKGIKGLKDRLDTKPKMSLASFADRYVFLTESMKELFPVRPYTIIEGFLPAEQFDYNNIRVPKSILYTGTLGRKFGIQTLLEAFSLIEDPEYQLWICGSGDQEQEVRLAAKKDCRIRFMGFLPKQQITALQTQCDVLINPRTDEGEYTKYSFPSKTMEYLLSGSKVVMHRLAGIGDAYYRYIRVIQGQDALALKEAIVAACEDRDFYQSRWQEQMQWIMNHKSAKQQVQKIKKQET